MRFCTLPVRELPISCVSLPPRKGHKPASLEEAAAPQGRVRAQTTWTLESKRRLQGCSRRRRQAFNSSNAGARALLYPSRKVIESGGAAPARTSAAARPRQTESRARWGDACVALGFRVQAARLEPTASFSIFEWWEGPGAGGGLECRILGHDSSALERLHGRVQSQLHSLASV